MPRRTDQKSVMLVDDHPMLREGLARVIEGEEDLAVCCEAADASEAMQLLERARPDLVLVDISLEGKSGLELIKDIRALHPQLLILVMSMHDEALYAERVLRAGARGYVMKKAGGELVVKAIRQVLHGKIYLSERMSARILSSLAEVRGNRKISPIEMLTDREFETFKLLGEGQSTREIAERLRLSRKTVDVYRQNLKRKFGVKTATSLVQLAVRWVETESPL
jgi:DNA-binding NarL/FixJ family response regulator